MPACSWSTARCSREGGDGRAGSTRARSCSASRERTRCGRDPLAPTTCLRETCGVGKPALDRVRTIVRALPGVSERVSHGEPCFFVSATRALCYYHDNHNGDGRVSLWCPAPPGVQDELVNAEPGRFFKPPVSARGTFADWLGVFLDTT